jgi:pantoate--beta-alanine ligase
MKVCNTIEEIRSHLREAKTRGHKIGFVPTMGALHKGHISLTRAARGQADIAVASIFVNPTQFGPNEDFARYPRTFERDCEMLQNAQVDFVFAPSVNEMYPSGALTYVTVEGLSNHLCGRSRPGHFRGVTTVVSKLFNIIEPQLAFFGQKDAAQVAIIRRMVRDLNFPVEIVACPTVREADGLAMSSRNAYLDPDQRKSALVLSRALMRMEDAFRAGESRASELMELGMAVLRSEPEVRLDYLEIVDPGTLEPIQVIKHIGLAAVAAFVGTTRLIDNVVLQRSTAA